MNNVHPSLDTRLAEQFSRSQLQFTGMPANGISGDIITVIAEPDARVKRVGVRLLSFPDDLVIGANAIKIGIIARKSIWAFQYDKAGRGLHGFINFCM